VAFENGGRFRVCFATCRFSPPFCSLVGTGVQFTVPCLMWMHVYCRISRHRAGRGIEVTITHTYHTPAATEGTAARILSVYRGILYSPFAKYPASEDLVLLSAFSHYRKRPKSVGRISSVLSLSLSLSVLRRGVSSISEEINRNDYPELELAKGFRTTKFRWKPSGSFDQRFFFFCPPTCLQSANLPQIKCISDIKSLRSVLFSLFPLSLFFGKE